MAKARILIVEDERIVAEDIKRTLQNLGYVVSSIVSSGEEAVEKTEEDKPDLVLMDIMLKGNIDGVEAAEQIQAHFDVPLIYVTASADSKTLQRAKATAPFGYLIKPFSKEELQTSIEIALYKYNIDKKLKESEEKYKTLTENVSVGIYRNTVGPNGKFIEVNPAIIKMFGYESKKEFLSITVANLYQNPEYRKTFNEKMLTQGFVKNEELRLKKRNGTPFFGSVSTVAVKDENGNVEYYDGIIEDITERKQAEERLRESEERYKDLVEKADVGIVVDTIEGNFKYINRRFAELFGYSVEEMRNKSIESLIHPDDISRIMKFHMERMQGKDVPKGYEFRGVRKDGSVIYLEIHVVELKDADKITGTRSYIWDVSERKRAEDELRTLTIIDGLTGLRNRRGFTILAQQQLKLAKRTLKGFWILYADLDKMKWINDNLGHKVGDEALKELADVFRRTFRKSDIIARIGGDEFAILAIEARKDSSDILIERLQKNIEDYNKKQQHRYKLSLSIGKAYYNPEVPISIDELLNKADEMMYKQKRSKKKI